MRACLAEGGPSDEGTVFSLPITGGTPTVLQSTLGLYWPAGDLILSGDTLFGTSVHGIPTIFAISTTSDEFTGGINTADDQLVGGLFLSGNTLYAATEYEYGESSEGGSILVMSVVPEPASLALLAIGGLALLARWRRAAAR